MSDEPESEVSETTLIEPPRRLDVADLPQSPKSTFLAAEACGWLVRAWLAVGEVAPTLYVSNSDEGAKKPHSAGEVLFDGYTARMFTIDSRHPDLPLGFRAHYLGKVYANGRKAPLGSFDYALAVDPVGVARELRAEYKPIKQDRGKYETTKSFQRRLTAAKEQADAEDVSYNVGSVVFQHRVMFDTAGEFDSWLADWRSFVPVTTKKVKSHA